MGSSISGFRVDWIDGVAPDDVSPKSYPYVRVFSETLALLLIASQNWNFDHKPTEYAARRAHVNGMRRYTINTHFWLLNGIYELTTPSVVEDRLGSAIIMEDDADWDVSIKTQLQSFASAVRSLQSAQKSPTTSPYGDDWDILWLGHCGVECKTHQPYHLTPNDPTIPASRHFLPYWRDPPPIDRPDDMRLTCAANDGVCSLFYAVSYRGAQRILAALSVNPSGLAEEIDTGAQFDVSLGRMCGHGFLRCFTTYPALTGTYHSAGPSTKASDIHSEEGDSVGFSSRGVVYSTMLNINRLLKGERTVKATWDDVAVPELNPEDVKMREGFTPFVGRKRSLWQPKRVP